LSKVIEKKPNEDSGLNHLFIGNIESTIAHDDFNSEFYLKSEFMHTDHCVFNLNTGSFVDVLADSGASLHVWPSDRVGPIFKTAKMANGSSCEINDIRDVLIIDELGTEICLRNAHYVKGVEKHIISINALRKDGWKLMDNGNVKFTYLAKDDCRATFIEKENNLHYLQVIEVSVGVNNIAINTPGKLPAVLSKEDDEDLAEVINNEEKNENNRPKSKFTAMNFKHTSENKSNAKGYKHTDINLYHDLHGHDGLSRMRAKAKVLGIHLIGTLHCDACSTVKGTSAAIQRQTNHPAKEPNEQMFLDTTDPFRVRVGQRGRLSNLFLFGCSDKYSSKMLFGFGSEKSDVISIFEDIYYICNGKNPQIKNVTMDNAGENLAISKFCRHKNIGFKFTPPDTPKLNGMIERGVAIRLEKAKVLMKNANLNVTSQSNKIILMEAIKTAAFLYDECPKKIKLQLPNELWYGLDYK